MIATEELRAAGQQGARLSPSLRPSSVSGLRDIAASPESLTSWPTQDEQPQSVGVLAHSPDSAGSDHPHEMLREVPLSLPRIRGALVSEELTELRQTLRMRNTAQRLRPKSQLSWPSRSASA